MTATCPDPTPELLRAAFMRVAAHLGGDPADDLVVIPRDEILGTEGRLAQLADRCQLSGDEVDLLVLASAVRFDADFATLFVTGSQRPVEPGLTFGVALELMGRSLWDPDDRLLVHADGALCRHRLLTVGDRSLPEPFQRVDVPERLIRHLLGDDALDPLTNHARVPLIPVRWTDAVVVARGLESGVGLVHLRERPRGSARGAAAAALVEADRPGLGFDLARVAPDALHRVVEAAVLEAVLSDAVLVLGPIEKAAVDTRFLELLGDAPCPVIVHGRDRLPEDCSVQHQLNLDVGPLDRTDRLELWQTVLEGSGIARPDDLEQIATVPLAPERALHAALIAEATSVAEDRDMVAQDLVDAARAQGSGRLETLARRIRPAARFADLVVTDEVSGELDRIVGRIRHQDRVRTDWGLGEVCGRSRGVTALFAGPSGTGKTFSAEALAGELGVELYVIDLSSLVDKYIGETEKNLERVFDAAEAQGGVLFFDEADALFGKRSEVRDAHDRFANIETAYLLQRIELFDGISVMATNLRANLDPAFVRRLDAIVAFDEPDEPARLRLWRRHLPPDVPLADDVDLAFLAGALPLTGALIRNACLDAAFAAAADGQQVTMAHLVRSMARTQRMSGRLLDVAAFGPWASVLG